MKEKETLTTEIYKGDRYWHIVVKKNNEYLTTLTGKTKKWCNQVIDDSKFLQFLIDKTIYRLIK